MLFLNTPLYYSVWTANIYIYCPNLRFYSASVQRQTETPLLKLKEVNIVLLTKSIFGQLAAKD